MRQKVSARIAGFEKQPGSPSTPTRLPMHSTDTELLQMVAQRDRAAFEALYRRYRRRLFGFVARWVPDVETVEEVVDDTLFAVWKDAEKFQGRSRVSTWVFGIAHHQAMAALRRRREEESLDESPEQVGEDPELGAVIARGALRRALDELSPEHRAVVTLTYYEGCSYPEIAEILDCPVSTVKTRMFFARKKLRKSLQRGGLRGGVRAEKSSHGF